MVAVLFVLVHATFSILQRLHIVKVPYTPISRTADPTFRPTDIVTYAHAKECFKVSGIDLSNSVPERPSAKLESHYQDVLKATAPWRSHDPEKVRCHMGFCGPWLENWWSDYFCCDLPQTSFGPYVPLFIQWFDFTGKPMTPAKDDLQLMLAETLRPDVIYITVSHDAEGIRLPYKKFPNILVFSAGGVGHVPLPHIYRPLASVDVVPDKHFMSFAGKVKNRSFRPLTVELFNASLEAHGLDPVELFYSWGAYSVITDTFGMGWQDVVQRSQLNLAPRGYGITSYRLYELLHLGAIPIDVWGPYRWLPYQCSAGSENLPTPSSERGLNWTDFSYEIEWSVDRDVFETRIRTLVDELIEIQESTPEVFQQRREHILSLKKQFFTHEAIMDQIHRFMVDPATSDLCCDQLQACFTMDPRPGVGFNCQLTPKDVHEWGAKGGEWGGKNGPLG